MKEVEMERLLKPLGNRRRLMMLTFIRKRKSAHVGQIAEAMRLSLTATSRHLSLLERVGYLEKEQENLYVYYRIASDAPKILSNVLAAL
jgi:DNA-binding transcriptional ArsR family regulator